jgi:alpha-glucosidase
MGNREGNPENLNINADENVNANVILQGHARFTLLTDRMIRMEWSDDCRFVDMASLAVVNRAMPAVSFEKEERENLLILETRYLKLEYRETGKPFSRGNLSVTVHGDESRQWHPGKRDSRNLKGSLRTLDRCNGALFMGRGVKKGRDIDLGMGLLTRGSWTVYDDSGTVLREPERKWVIPRSPSHKQDLYLLAYGRAHKEALKDASRIFGAQPLPPRYCFGAWWSRYWAYMDRELEELVEEFDTHQVPLDVLVVDMDWHLSGWTGYTWNRDYFPDPKEFLRWAKSKGLKVTLNLHPADGIGKHEEAFDVMARDIGLEPDKIDRIPFDCADPRFVQAYFKRLHHPMEKMGVDFWWMDWQQGKQTAIKGLDPLPWLNILHWEDYWRNRRGKRPIIFSRYGGIGSGRYPVGFSGDTYSTWESLAYQPYFTATASNVLYGYWSHDIGGHMPGQIEPELYTRWVQFGILSPVFRTHTTKNPQAERRVWEYPSPYRKHMVRAIRQRYEMVPYIYTECRKGVDSGLSICRPLYYEWPDLREAYERDGQYYLGDSFLAAPVTVPRDAATDMAEVDVWLPPGRWFDTATCELLEGNHGRKRRYLLEEMPLFVRPGTLVPGQGGVLRLDEGGSRSLIITVWSGKGGAYSLYEDDGQSQAYLEGEGAWIDLSYTEDAGTKRLVVHPAKGHYRKMKTRRSLEIRFPAIPPPRNVLADGQSLPWSFRPKKRGWSYSGDLARVVVRVPVFDTARGLTLELTCDNTIPAPAIRGLPGLLRRLALVHYYSHLCYGVRPVHPEQSLSAAATQTGNRISRDPSHMADELLRLSRICGRMPRLLREVEADLSAGSAENDPKPGYMAKASRIFGVVARDYRELLSAAGNLEEG